MSSFSSPRSAVSPTRVSIVPTPEKEANRARFFGTPLSPQQTPAAAPITTYTEPTQTTPIQSPSVPASQSSIATAPLTASSARATPPQAAAAASPQQHQQQQLLAQMMAMQQAAMKQQHEQAQIIDMQKQKIQQMQQQQQEMQQPTQQQAQQPRCPTVSADSASFLQSLPSQFDVPATHRLHAAYSHPLLHKWQGELPPIQAHELVFPIFVHDLEDQKTEIKSLPEQYRWGVNRLDELLAPLVALGLRSVLLFGVPTLKEHKDVAASFATSPKSPVALAIKLIRSKYPSLLIMCDICLCAYTANGHCGFTKEDFTIDNQPSINRIAEMAVFLAQCGAHIVAPSDMMDGRIGAIKLGLKRVGLDGRVSVMSYAAKFASVFYGPFRDAAGSGAQFGDRSCYQLPSAGRGLAMKAVKRDLEEGADFIMVKPGTPYLDIVRDIKNITSVPIAIYHVSGEYAMLWHAAAAGAFGLAEGVNEALMGAKRAGATILITYFTPFLLKQINEQHSVACAAAHKASGL